MENPGPLKHLINDPKGLQRLLDIPMGTKITEEMIRKIRFKNDETREEAVDVIYEFGRSLYADEIKDIPAEISKNCAERYHGKGNNCIEIVCYDPHKENDPIEPLRKAQDLSKAKKIVPMSKKEVQFVKYVRFLNAALKRMRIHQEREISFLISEETVPDS